MKKHEIVSVISGITLYFIIKAVVVFAAPDSAKEDGFGKAFQKSLFETPYKMF